MPGPNAHIIFNSKRELRKIQGLERELLATLIPQRMGVLRDCAESYMFLTAHFSPAYHALYTSVAWHRVPLYMF